MADDNVRARYDEMADIYTQHVVGSDLSDGSVVVGWLDRFALQIEKRGVVADLGCGPGHVTAHLSELGLDARGYDLSPALVANAKTGFPDLEFHVADMASLDVADAAFAGIVSRHSIIHRPPDDFDRVVNEWARVLQRGAPLLVSFFAADTVERHGTPFDHAVVTAYELFPATVTQGLEAAGFDIVDSGLRPPGEGERQLHHSTILARRRLA